MDKRRFQINLISLFCPAAEPVLLWERHAPRNQGNRWSDAELEDIIGSAMDAGAQRRQRQAARAPRASRRVKPTDGEIVATFEAELAKLKGRGKRVKGEAIKRAAEELHISDSSVKRRL